MEFYCCWKAIGGVGENGRWGKVVDGRYGSCDTKSIGEFGESIGR